MKYFNYIKSLAFFTALLLLLIPREGLSQGGTLKSYRDLPVSIRQKVQKEALYYKQKSKNLQGRVQLGHLFLCEPFCSKVGHIYFAKGAKKNSGVQINIGDEVPFEKKESFRFIPRKSNLYIVFKNDPNNLQEKDNEEAKDYKPVVLSKGDDTNVFQVIGAEYLLPFQKKRWGILTSFQTLFAERRVSTRSDIGSGWETPWSLFLKPRMEIIPGLEVSSLRFVLGVDYTFSPLGEGTGVAAGQLSSSVFGGDLSVLVRLSPNSYLGIHARYDRTLLDFDDQSTPTAFTSASDILWLGLRAHYRWLSARLNYGLPLKIEDEINLFRGNPEITQAFSGEAKYCPFSFQLLGFDTFPCAYVGYRLETQFSEGGTLGGKFDAETETTIRNVQGGITLEMGSFF